MVPPEPNGQVWHSLTQGAVFFMFAHTTCRNWMLFPTQTLDTAEIPPGVVKMLVYIPIRWFGKSHFWLQQSSEKGCLAGNSLILHEFQVFGMRSKIIAIESLAFGVDTFQIFTHLQIHALNLSHNCQPPKRLLKPWFGRRTEPQLGPPPS